MRKDGTLFWANVVITAIYGRSGDLIGFAKVTRDMSERHRLEELERSSRRMSEFLAMLAHELRNPLAPIRNAVTVMQLETLPSPALRNCRDIIDRQLTHMTRLVDDLLDVGRLTTGKIKLRREVLRVGEIIARGVETARPLIEARRHTLKVELPGQPLYVNGDATRMSQILQNLLVNAAKYTPDGGHISVKAEALDGFAVISVSDNGRGIATRGPREHLQPFHAGRQRKTRRKRPGHRAHGRALAGRTARRQARRAQPRAGPGQHVRVPAAGRAGSAGRKTTAQDRPGQSDARRVMVVDDNRDAADSATAILRLLGHQVECAYSGPAAVELARHFRPAVVLMDLAMPGMNGFETLRQMRSQPGTEHVFAIAMTGFGSGEDQRRTEAAGFDAHLTKPADLNALVALLDRATAQSSQ